MKVKNLNHSSKKTKTLIRNTFAELIKENQELNKVTVSELVKRADINRSTFYNHYDSIYDVAEEFESEVIQVLFENNQKLESKEDVFEYLDNVMKYLKENEEIYRLLLSSKEPLLFLEKLNRSILNKLYTSLGNNINLEKNKSLKFNITFFTDGIINHVLKYFNGASDCSLDEICEYAKEIFAILFKM